VSREFTEAEKIERVVATLRSTQQAKRGGQAQQKSTPRTKESGATHPIILRMRG